MSRYVTGELCMYVKKNCNLVNLGLDSPKNVKWTCILANSGNSVILPSIIFLSILIITPYFTASFS